MRGLCAGSVAMIARIIPFVLCCGLVANISMRYVPTPWLAEKKSEFGIRFVIWSMAASLAMVLTYPLDVGSFNCNCTGCC